MKIIMEHFGKAMISGVVFALLFAILIAIFQVGAAGNIISTFSTGIC